MCEAKHRPDPQLSTGTIKIQLMIATRFIANHRDDMALRLIDVELRSDNMLMKENIYLDIERSPDLGMKLYAPYRMLYPLPRCRTTKDKPRG